MQEGKVSEIGRNPEEYWERCWGGFCWCCLLPWCWRWGLRWSSRAPLKRFCCLSSSKCSPNSGWSQPHPIQDDLDVNFEAKKQDVPKIRNPNLDFPSFSDAILVTSSLEKGEAYKQDTKRLLVNTLFKVNNSKSDNIKEFELASSTARVMSVKFTRETVVSQCFTGMSSQ